MSLAVLANHMATKGRHGDDMLVHMSKDEVAALQRLAEQHGLTLTINPETGLPEAFSLKSLLKTVAPLALGWALGPAGFGLFETSLGASLAVGGIGALATGSLEKGLMMGLSAYGGSELGGALKAAGAAATPVAVSSGAEAAGAGATISPETSRQLAMSQFGNAPEVAAAQQMAAAVPTPSPAFTPPVENMFNQATGQALMTPAQAFSQLPVSDQISNIYKGVSAAPGEFLKSQYKNIGLAALPAMLAAQPSGIKGVSTDTDPSKVRFSRFAFDPLTRTMVRVPGFSLADYRAGTASPVGSFSAADGGIVALADGGVAMTPSYQNASMSPGMLDFAGRSEPVVRMADGGATREEVLQAYANTPGAVLNPTEGAVNYWMSQGLGGFADAVSGARASMTPEQLTSIDAQRAAATAMGNVAATPVSGAATDAYQAVAPSATDTSTVTNIYRNVLGRDPDAEGLAYWSTRLASGEGAQSVYNALQQSAKDVLGQSGVTTLPTTLTSPLTLQQATSPYYVPPGYSATSGLNTTMGDEWVRNVLGRPVTAADTQQSWYKALDDMRTVDDLKKAYSAFLSANKVDPTKAPNWFTAAQIGLQKNPVLKPPTTTTPFVIQPPGTQPSGTAPVIPGAGPVPTMNQVVNAYTQGGGSLGYIPYAPKSMEELNARYPMTGATKAIADYMAGKGPYPTVQKVPGGIAQPYWQAAGMTPPTYTKKTFPSTTDTTSTTVAPTGSYTGLTADDKTAIQNALSTAKSSKNFGPFNSLLNAYKLTKADLLAAFPTMSEKEIADYLDKINFYVPPAQDREALGGVKAGGLMNLAGGGMSEMEQLSMMGGAAGGISHLGDYSDGGRLLKGPGDGVSDDIPATIGDKRPARLADGEFVVPARIVSELGNGSTDAGARKLYAMMDRIQANRSKTVGKGKVAVNSRADKYLPA